MTRGPFRLAVTVLFLVVAPFPAAGQETDQEPIINISVPVQVELGEEFEITATVRDSVTGEPVTDTEVAFWSDGSFAGVNGEFEIGTARTNEIGVVTLQHRFNVTRIHSIRAEVVGSPMSSAESVSVPVMVGGQLVSTEVGVDIPGFGAWIVPFVIGGVWVIMVIAAFAMAAIFRAGRDADEPVSPELEGSERALQPDSVRPRINAAAIATGVMAMLAVGLVAILMRSPNTHANVDPVGYDRSAVAYLDAAAAYLYEGLGVPESVHTGNPAEDGRLIFVGNGCAGCHGLNGQGTAAAGSPVTVTREWLGSVVRSGLSGGMPAFSSAQVSETDLDMIAAFFEVAQQALDVRGVASPAVSAPADGELTAPDSSSASDLSTADAVDGALTFSADVAVVLSANCAACHGTLGGWSATDYDAVINSGDNGPAVIPGNPDGSLLAQKLLGTQTTGGPMPPSGSLAEADIELIVAWIAQGAGE